MEINMGTEPFHSRIQCQFLQPLQTPGRFRNTDVEQQICTMLQCTQNERLRRSRLTDSQTREFVSEEALIYLIRHLFRSDDPNAALDLMECLFKRCIGRIQRKVWALLPACSREDKEDCARSVLVEMTRLIQIMDASKEFWEVNFTTCLERLCSNCAHKYRRFSSHELRLEAFEEEGEGNRLEQIPDNRGLTPQQRIELREALTLLKDHERTAVLLTAEGLTQQQIAEFCGVTDKTVRNWLRSAKERLTRSFGEYH